MAYIPPREFSSSPEQGGKPNVCDSCGYSLQGLPSHAACPECGENIHVNRRTYTADIPLSEMSEQFIRRLAISCVTTTIVIPIVAARIFVPFFQFRDVRISLLVDLLIAGIWITGVMLLTRPLKNPQAKMYGLGEKGTLRKLARWCSLGAVGIVFFFYFAVQSFLFFSLVITAIGIICLFLLLANVADWVRDRKAKKWMEYAAWGATLFFACTQLLLLIQGPAIFSIITALFGAILFVGGVLGMCMLTSSVVQAVTHARHHQEYLERRVKSKEDSPLPTPKD